MPSSFAISTVLVLGAALPGVMSAVGAQATRYPWPGDLIGRTQSLAALQSLEIALLSRDSATLTLDAWCAAHTIAPAGTKVVADRDRAVVKAPTAEQRRLLGVGADEPIRYRRVRLRCGDVVMSEADNWYVPSRLTPQMNAALESTDIPFGRVVQPLRFHRQTLSARLLWSPLPVGWDSGTQMPITTAVLDVAKHVIENQALLVSAAGVPFSQVVETYTDGVLNFAPPSRMK